MSWQESLEPDGKSSEAACTGPECHDQSAARGLGGAVVLTETH